MKFDLYHGDCLEVMPLLEDNSIDLILTDLPYGVTQNKWDSIINLPELWYSFKRLLKPNGVIALSATQPFTSKLVSSNLEMFRYEYIWEKTLSSRTAKC